MTSPTALSRIIDRYLSSFEVMFGNLFNHDHESTILAKFLNLEQQKRSLIYDRKCHPGHITGSALLLNPSMTKIVLTHHKKLGKWLQLGGHCDGENNPAAAAQREALEESGLTIADAFCPLKLECVPLSSAAPIDFDIHDIPETKTEPAHFHFDVRYIFTTTENKLEKSSESNDLGWFTLEEVLNLTNEEATTRQIHKVMHLRSKIAPRGF